MTDITPQLDARTILPGRYRHYKGGEYQVFGTAYHSETEELLVHYQTLYGNRQFWVRPYDMFTELVEVGGETIPRFLLLEESVGEP